MMKKLTVLLVVAILAIGCTSQKKKDDLFYPVKDNAQKETPKTDNQVVAANQQQEVILAEEEMHPVNNTSEIVLEDNSAEIVELEAKVGSLESNLKTKDEELNKSAEEQEKLKRENEELRQKLAQVQQEEKQATLKNVSLDTAPSANKQNYLRIIALPEHEYYKKMASDIVSHLEKEGITKAAPRKSGKYWVIDISDCPTPYSTEGKSFQDRIRNMKYQGIRQFQDAYYVTY